MQLTMISRVDEITAMDLELRRCEQVVRDLEPSYYACVNEVNSVVGTLEREAAAARKRKEAASEEHLIAQEACAPDAVIEQRWCELMAATTAANLSYSRLSQAKWRNRYPVPGLRDRWRAMQTEMQAARKEVRRVKRKLAKLVAAQRTLVSA